MPTLEALALPTASVRQADAAPTSVVRKRVGGVLPPTYADRAQTHLAVARVAIPPPKSVGRKPLAPGPAVSAFLDWLREHGLGERPRPVEDIWYLASEDFALATDVLLPSRNRFLGALQRLDGVRVQYEKRVSIGSRKVKTTVYTFSFALSQPTAGAYDAAAHENATERHVLTRVARAHSGSPQTGSDLASLHTHRPSIACPWTFSGRLGHVPCRSNVSGAPASRFGRGRAVA